MAILPRSSYYTKDYRQTAALIRARQPYLIKNIFTGLGLFAFAISVYSFTFYAVKQDDFSDVVAPGPEAKGGEPSGAVVQSPHAPHTSMVRSAGASATEFAKTKSGDVD